VAIGDIIVGIDIGVSKVSCVIGQVNKFSEIEVIGYGLSSNSGVKKGQIIDPKTVSQSVKEAINSAEQISELSVNSAYVNIKGMNVRIEKVVMESEVARPDDGMTINDIYNLFAKIQLTTNLARDEQIIDILPHEYIVNGRSYKEEPIGAFCKTFTMEVEVVIAKGSYIEGESGVLLVDIGGGHTDISVYKNSKIEFYTTIPVGGDHITNDIALTFNISTDEAEKLKRQYNLAIMAMITNNHEIKLSSKNMDQQNNVIKCSDVVQVIEARVKEIYQIIKKMIIENNLNGKIESMVLTGQGISNIVGVEELAMLTLKLNQVRVCSPKLINIIKPQHTTVFGMVRYIASLGLSKHVNSDVEIITDPNFKEKIWESIHNLKNKIFSFNRKFKKIDEEE